MRQLIYNSKTDTGKVRPVNEDNHLLEFWSAQSALLAVVADGMEGRKGRKRASEIAINTFRELLNQLLPSEPLKKYEPNLSRNSFRTWW